MRNGTLISSEDYVRIVIPYLSKQEYRNHPLILSSVGRWLGEEEGVIKATKDSGHDMKTVVFLTLSDKHIIERWEAHRIIGDRGDRHDDTLAILKHRLQEFHTKTMPVIEEYRKLGLLEEIDGELSRDEVTAEILRRLASRASA
jgi:adenylate kinase